MEVVKILDLIRDMSRKDGVNMSLLDALAIVRDLANENVIECYDHDDALEEIMKEQLDAIYIMDLLLDVLRKKSPVIIDPEMAGPDLFLAKTGGKS